MVLTCCVRIEYLRRRQACSQADVARIVFAVNKSLSFPIQMQYVFYLSKCAALNVKENR